MGDARKRKGDSAADDFNARKLLHQAKYNGRPDARNLQIHVRPRALQSHTPSDGLRCSENATEKRNSIRLSSYVFSQSNSSKPKQ